MEKITNKPTESAALQSKGAGSVSVEKKPVVKTVPPRPVPASAPPKMATTVAATAGLRTAAAEKREVRLEIYERNARAVSVAGSFNAWNPRANILKNNGTGKWETVLMLPPGRYEYRFVVDGNWIPDPLAKESVANPYGGTNSILTVR